MINTINGFSSNHSLNSTTSSEVVEIIESHKKSNSPVNETTSNTNGNLYLSSRATKINALSTEFFSKGALSFNDVDALKESAYQLGLISKQEFDRLSNTEPNTTNSQLSQEMSSETLASFAGSFVERLDATNDDKSDTEEESESIIVFKEALMTAKNILSNIDEAKKSPDFKESLTAAITTLRETISADSFEIIPLDDKVGISKVYQALEIVDQISHKRLSNTKVNQYIQVSFN